MIIYHVNMKYESCQESYFDKPTLNPKVDDRRMKNIISDVNDSLGEKCGLNENLSVAVVNGEYKSFEIVIVCKLENVSLHDCEKWIKNHFLDNYSLEKVWLENKGEISAKEFENLTERANGKGFGYLHNVWSNLGFDYFDNRQFTVQEMLYPDKKVSKKEILRMADEIMADGTLLEEIERIFSADNQKKYYGNPVHYMIKAGNSEAARDIIEILILALNANKRILGRRVSYVNKIKEGCYDEDDLTNLFSSSSGAAVAIDMSGNDEDHGVYATAYHQVVDFIANLMDDNNLYTLCFLVQITEKPGFGKDLVAAVQDNVTLIEICEGKGDKEKAVNYLERLTEKTDFETTRDELAKALPKKTKTFSATEVYKTYNKWFSNGLTNKVYCAYKQVEKVNIEVKKGKNEPYKDLQKMVGLTEIKNLVDQIINTSKIRKARSKMGMDTHSFSQHMIFTGNPGSAKTTVARLLADILKKEGILETGNFVECGRADLVARFVGWTAKTVKEKFNKASGGILFIDEAYALVDDTNSFGAEAINTIVQEMENRRDSVIVIFAGYPEKMEEFLAGNEGLRSRIAFHLDFPDYNADEMLQILELMVEDKGYLIDEDVKEKCHDIFSVACSKPEFGNGRFARNLLEQAIMKQSDRLVKNTNGKKIGREDLSTLVAEDFSVNAEKVYKKSKTAIGFV